MLEPDTRVVLLDQLRPPPGYNLHAAVATTFTLDLATAVVAPLAFASFETRGTPDPVAVLEAVRSCTDRVNVFCQAGQISVPAQHSDLMAYLEPMVHPVRRPKGRWLFHPKVWFLHYRADEEPDRFRLLCSSRNLTDSHAWDAIVTLNGTAGKRNRAQNRPLKAFIRQLTKLAVNDIGTERKARVAALADAAARVDWELPEHVNEVVFHAFGVRGVNAKPDFSGYRHLVISPFCNDDGLKRLVENARGEVTIVSRAETLDVLGSSGSESRQMYVMDPMAALSSPEAAQDDAATEATGSPRQGVDTLNGLHAKVNVIERNRRAHVFIGSPNATGAAYGGNVEFAVELIGGASKLGVGTYLDAGSQFAELLVPYDGDGQRADPNEELLRALMSQLRALAEVAMTLTVARSEAETDHELRLESEIPVPLRPGFEVKAELLTRPGHAVNLHENARVDHVFTHVDLPDITPFVALFVKDVEHLTASNPLEVSTVVHARLVNDPDSRLDEVLARQIDTPEKFLRFVALLLGLGSDDPFITRLSESSGTGAWQSAGGLGIFEIVINALATNQQALLDLGSLVERLRSTKSGRAVLPDGFYTLWGSVQDALDALREHA